MSQNMPVPSGRWMGRWIRAGLPAVVLSLASCVAFRPDDKLVQQAGQLPDAYNTDIPAATNRLDRWWTRFGDEQLDALVNRALHDNLTLQQVAARLRQAQAVAVQKGAPLI
ncbi:MAG: hypothetical protein V2A34_08430, partial [Lentisphaerota bacterium]